MKREESLKNLYEEEKLLISLQLSIEKATIEEEVTDYHFLFLGLLCEATVCW